MNLGYLQTYHAKQLGATATRLYFHSHVCRILLRRYVAHKIARERPFVWPDVFKPNGFHEKDWKEVESEFEKMIDLARGIRAQIAFLHIPVSPVTVSLDGLAAYPPKRLSEWAAAKGVVFIDTLPPIREGNKHQPLYWEHDGHCNTEGNRVIAETIYSTLIEKKLVP